MAADACAPRRTFERMLCAPMRKRQLTAPLTRAADFDLSPYGVVGNSGWNACFLNNFLGRRVRLLARRARAGAAPACHAPRSPRAPG